MTRRTEVILLIAVLVSLSGAGIFVQAANGYQVSVSNSIQLPQQEVTIDGERYTFSAIGRVDDGNDFSVNLTGPENETFQFYLYNENQQIVKAETIEEAGDVIVSTDDLDAGLYVASAYDNGTIQDIQPVVVEAYQVSATVPDEATVDGTIRVTAEISGDSSVPIEQVDVTILSESTNRTVPLSNTGGQEYAGNVSLDGLPTGTYSVYIAARTDETAYNRQVPVGLSGRSILDITEQTATPTPTQTTTTDSGNTPGDDTTTTSGGATSTTEATPTGTTKTTTTTRTTTVVTTTTRTTTVATTTDPGDSTRNTETTNKTRSTATPVTRTTTDAVITPGSTTSAEIVTTTGGQSGFSVISLGLATGLFLFLYRRRS